LKLNRSEIISNEVVGKDHHGNPVHHIKTLGGAHFMVAIDPYGETTVLSTAAHRAFAKSQAEGKANIDWDQSSNLFKSEAMSVPAAPVESNPTNHFKQAAYFSKRFGKVKKTPNPTFEDKLLMVMLQESALNHYKMMGDDDQRAKRNHEIQSHYHSEVGDDYNPPFDNEALVNAFEAKQAAPETQKSETLEKDRGRITFPADPKITNRPDQEVKRVDMSSDASKGVTVRRAANAMSNPVSAQNMAEQIDNSLDNKQVRGATSPSGAAGHKHKAYSKANDPTNEHEGLHYLMSEIEKKHGYAHRDGFLNHLLNHVDKSTMKGIDELLQSSPMYNNLLHTGPRALTNYKEEVIAHIRDIANGGRKSGDSAKREHFLGKFPDRNKADSDLKSSWDKIRQASGTYTLPVNKMESYPSQISNLFFTENQIFINLYIISILE